MIRPITVICLFLALGAGLYLYRAKHEVEMMDRHIEQIAKETNDLRAESRRLLDDWIRLGEPEQLHRYSDQYLGLKSIAPTQFIRLTDLQNRLPAPRVDPPEELAQTVDQSPDVTPSAGGSPSDSVQQATAKPDETDVAGADDLPVPPIPPLAPPVAAVTAPAVAIAAAATVASNGSAKVTSVSLAGVTTPPLQAKPVTPRPASGQQEPAAARQRSPVEIRTVDEPRAAPPRLAPVTIGEPRQPPRALPVAFAPGPPIIQSSDQPRALPPLQERSRPSPNQGQAYGNQGQAPNGMPPQVMPPQGLPPPQSRGLAVQPGASPTMRQPDPRSADPRMNDARRDTRPAPFQSIGQQFQGPVVQQQAPRQPVQGNAAPGPAGSLLGSRGVVPLPLPAPMPVNSTWSGPAGAGR